MNQRSFDNQTSADCFYISEARAESLATDDPKGKIVLQSAVGALITKKNVELARSANVLPPLVKETMLRHGEAVTDESRYHLIEHAERAAIFKAYRLQADLTGSTIYCTRFPCSDCARAIVWAGITRAVFAGGFGGEKRWIASQRAALKILRDGGVKVRYFAEKVPT